MCQICLRHFFVHCFNIFLGTTLSILVGCRGNVVGSYASKLFCSICCFAQLLILTALHLNKGGGGGSFVANGSTPLIVGYYFY